MSLREALAATTATLAPHCVRCSAGERAFAKQSPLNR